MEKPGFLTLAAKLVVNVHDMNNEGSIGQTTDIRMIRMVGEDGKELSEAPAVSGRMMKHWHLAYMLREELQLGENAQLCDQCKVWEPERQPADEITGVKNCVICDSHGFLSAKKRVGEDKGKNLRRSSCVSFSWLLPVIGADTPSKQVIHSRVAPGVAEATEEVIEPAPTEASADISVEEKLNDKMEEEKKKTSQMIFYKSYASSVYGFICSIDLDRIGKAIDGNVVLDDPTKIKHRRQIAVKALLPMVMGAFGASQSHALPHAKCLGALVALSDNTTPLPNLISPIYSNGFEDSIKMLETLKVKYWGYGEADKGEEKQNLQAIFDKIIAEIK